MIERLPFLARLFFVTTACLVAASSTGCSIAIASRGATSVPTIAAHSTRQQVREALGAPVSSETRPDGTRIDHYLVRRKVGTLWDGALSAGGGGDARGLVLMLPALPILELVATAKALHDSDQQRMHLIFVHGADERLLYYYDSNAIPAERFETARRPLAASVSSRLVNEECPTWAACLASYDHEVRRRAGLVGYELAASDEERLRDLIDLGQRSDSGVVSRAVALQRTEVLLLGVSASPTPPNIDALHYDLWNRIDGGKCPEWATCIAVYEHNYRQRATSAHQPITPAVEDAFNSLREVAQKRDADRLSVGEARILVGSYTSKSRWSLGEVLWTQLKGGACPKWADCVQSHNKSYQRLAENVGVKTLPEVERDELRRLLDIAQGVDGGRLAPDAGLDAINGCQRGLQIYCLGSK